MSNHHWHHSDAPLAPKVQLNF